MTNWHSMFPGQGSFELGMGREIAENDAAAMAVYDEGSLASGLDLRQLCFEGTTEELTRTELQQPALVATCLAINAALRARGIEPDYVVGHSVGEFSALRRLLGSARDSPRTIALVRERGLCDRRRGKAERPGSRWPLILGLADEGRSRPLCR